MTSVRAPLAGHRPAHRDRRAVVAAGEVQRAPAADGGGQAQAGGGEEGVRQRTDVRTRGGTRLTCGRGDVGSDFIDMCRRFSS